ncbi:MAG: hypothetical protein ABSC08_20520 [Bryobacteraceae bacterium]|jgi:hypothetical protein
MTTNEDRYPKWQRQDGYTPAEWAAEVQAAHARIEALKAAWQRDHPGPWYHDAPGCPPARATARPAQPPVAA